MNELQKAIKAKEEIIKIIEGVKTFGELEEAVLLYKTRFNKQLMEKFTSKKEWEEFKKTQDDEFLFKEIIHPIGIVMDRYDSLILFYENLDEVFKEILRIYNYNEACWGNGKDEIDPPFCFGYEKPSKTTYKFLGKEYKGISFWYDGDEGDHVQDIFDRFYK